MKRTISLLYFKRDCIYCILTVYLLLNLKYIITLTLLQVVFRYALLYETLLKILNGH